jgi:hypothetical protein
MKECLWCGKGLGKGKKMYCNLKHRYALLCAMRDSGEVWEEFAAMLTCTYCGGDFAAVKGMHRDLCSDECRSEKADLDKARPPKTMPKISKFDRSACYRDGQCASYGKCSAAILTGKKWLCEDEKDHFKPESREVFMRPIFLQ